MTTLSTAARPTTVAIRRVRSGRPASLARRLEYIAGSPHRVDHRVAAGVDLLAKVRDVQLDDVGLPTEVVVPDPVEDLRLAQYPARVAHQVPQQLVLGGGEGDQV